LLARLITAADEFRREGETKERICLMVGGRDARLRARWEADGRLQGTDHFTARLKSKSKNTMNVELITKSGNKLGDLTKLNIAGLARVCKQDWTKVNYAAKPYLDAMQSLDKASDRYGYDDGVSIVLYFLSNASSWRGEIAKAVKAELKKRCNA
jgi:hypothetical protein